MLSGRSTNIKALRLRRRALIFRDLPSNNFLSSDTALGQEMTIMAGFGVAHKLYIYEKKNKKKHVLISDNSRVRKNYFLNNAR